MIRFYFNLAPNPAKVALMLEELGLPYEPIPVDADISAWGWLMRAPIVLPGDDDPLSAFSNVKRLVETVNARPAAARAKAVGKDHPFKKEIDEETKRAMFPSNYPEIAM